MQASAAATLYPGCVVPSVHPVVDCLVWRAEILSNHDSAAYLVACCCCCCVRMFHRGRCVPSAWMTWTQHCMPCCPYQPSSSSSSSVRCSCATTATHSSSSKHPIGALGPTSSSGSGDAAAQFSRPQNDWAHFTSCRSSPPPGLCLRQGGSSSSN